MNKLQIGILQKSVNKGSISATGARGLKVVDGAGADTGHIDSWSIEFL